MCGGGWSPHGSEAAPLLVPHLSPPPFPPRPAFQHTPTGHALRVSISHPPPPSCPHHPQGVVKLADFGVSAKLGELEEHRDELQQHVVGTPYWMAPEVRIVTPQSRAKPWPKP